MEVPNKTPEELRVELERVMNSKAAQELDKTLSESNARYADLSKSARLVALYLFQTGREDLIRDLWTAFYIRKPPTIEDFLTPEILGRTAITLYDKWREVLIETFAPDSQVWELVLTGSIGSGKTTCARLATIFNQVKLLHLREPQTVMQVMPETSLVISLLTVTIDKALKAIYEPYTSLYRACSLFKEVKKEREFSDFGDYDPIPWVDYGDYVQFPRRIMMTVGSQVSHAISFDMCSASLDEAEWRAGDSTKALDLYTELRQRIQSRFLGSRFNLLTLISSSKSSTGVIAQYTRTIAPNSKSTKVYGFPIWEIKSNDAYKKGYFYVLRGTKSHPSKMLSDAEYEMYEAGEFQIPQSCEVIKVPKVYETDFRANIEKAFRDIAGIQNVVDDRPFDDVTRIEDPILVPEFNVEAKLGDPIPLVQKLPRDLLFTKNPNGWQLKRYPNAWRYVHLDLAETAEAGISITHKELGDNGHPIHVVDMAMWITSPTRIDFTSIEQMLIDLAYEYNIRFHTITADQFQSTAIRQNLEKRRIAKHVKYQSVDRSPLAYLSLSSIVAKDEFKIGLCPKLRGQLSDLVIADNKVITTTRKDIADSICGAVENARCAIDDVPSYVYSHYVARPVISTKKMRNLDQL